MRSNRPVIAGFIVSAIWLIYTTYLVPWVFAGIAILGTPVFFFELFGENETLFYSMLFVFDSLIIFLLTAPIAYLYLKHLMNPWPYIIVAVAVGFLWSHRLILSDLELFKEFVTTIPAVFSIVSALLLLPITVVVMKKLSNSGHITCS